MGLFSCPCNRWTKSQQPAIISLSDVHQIYGAWHKESGCRIGPLVKERIVVLFSDISRVSFTERDEIFFLSLPFFPPLLLLLFIVGQGGFFDMACSNEFHWFLLWFLLASANDIIPTPACRLNLGSRITGIATVLYLRHRMCHGQYGADFDCHLPSLRGFS